MRISVFGLGYVGTVTSACLAHDVHDMISVDVNAEKVSLIRDGSSLTVAPRLDELGRAGVATGALGATSDSRAAVLAADLSGQRWDVSFRLRGPQSGLRP